MTSPAFIATGERIAQARRAAGLSRRELAEPLGLRIWDVEQMELGRSEPGDELLASIAEVLACSPLWLRSGAAVVQLDEKRSAELEERERELDRRERELERREEDLARREADLARTKAEAAAAVAAAAAANLPAAPGGWNVDTLARLVSQHGHAYPDRIDEWQATLQAMRSIVPVNEALPPELDALAREVFAPLLRGAA